MVEKNCFDMTKLFFQIMCVTVHGAVVKEFLARAGKSGSTPGDAAFCFFVPFFSLFGLCFFKTLFFLLAFFSLFLLQTLLVMHLDQYIF